MKEDATRIQAASERTVIEASLIRHLLPALIMKAVFSAHFSQLKEPLMTHFVM